MSTEDNKQVVRRFLDQAWNQKNLCIVDELLHPAFCRHVATEPYLFSREAQTQNIIMFHEAFPDLKLTIEEIIAERDMIVYRGLLRGTQLHEFRNVDPTRKQILLMVIGIVRVENGLIVEQWGGVNELDLLEQIDG
jgi:predicted ester cyclase